MVRANSGLYVVKLCFSDLYDAFLNHDTVKSFTYLEKEQLKCLENEPS